MKEWGDFLLQFGVSGAALAVLGLQLWIQGRKDRNSSERWEKTAEELRKLTTDVTEAVRNNTRAAERSAELLAIVKDRL